MAATVTRNALNQYDVAVSGGTTPSNLFIRNVVDWTKMLKRADQPFLTLIGRGKPQAQPMHKREWGWGSPDPISDIMNDAGGINTTDTTMTVTNGSYFSANDLIKIDDEIIRVTSISGNDLTIVRTYAGTNASHADASVIKILGPAIPENVDDPASPITQGEVDFNYHQIMAFTWQLSERARVTPTYESLGLGMNDRDKIELKKKMQTTAPQRLEQTLLNGLRVQGTSSVPSAMGGFLQSSYCTTAVDMGSNTVPLTEYDVMNNLQTVYNLVGPSLMPKTAMCHPFVWRVISSWYNADRIYGPKDDTAKLVWKGIDTWFGNIKIYVNYMMDQDELWFFNEDDFELCPYASSTGWQTGYIPVGGWYTKGFLRGDWTLVAQNPDSRLRIYDFSTTAADYPALA